ncbi:MAG TPA: ATP synthase F1 subunit delta [Syntrophorhabdaceae bacterium]|mgnify:CR=1 FL=1|nr:ATP synthase F1 subunit delta [Syntrophorhabdaceae bacterium]HOL05177.1 ATP synthase F1 subunit delta [Syntrophorhabdaceae bacterium]HON84756.1 ATP synthase F1 subunit delta [Syntrophorhabdaceae bacterium]HOT42110.1 ATP synthase F1 subunit delta [Syntrophorhabdaceae bacterium]HPC66283.1 ATP synthase F1 subunit delta [Syntrophorhabdaceae bacterium]
MISRSIAKRYARGLFAVGEKDGKYKQYLEELNAILDFFTKEQRLSRPLILPILEMSKRKDILAEVLKAFKVSVPLSNMFMMLLERNRMGYITVIRDVYSELVDEKEGRVRGTVWSAYALDAETKGRIEGALKEKLKKDVILDAIEDRSLIGGVKVSLKGTIIDGSVKRQLETLKENILKE